MIAFDLDGTLVDSAPDIIAAMQRAWAEVESTAFPGPRFRIGPPLLEMVRELGAVHPDAVAAAYRRIYDDSDFSTTLPYAAVAEILGSLGRIAIATNKRELPTKKIVARWFSGRFDRIACSDAVDGVAGRYSKAAMLRAIGASVLVGDTVGDVRAAREAGVRVVAVTWGYEAPELLAAAQPDALVHEPRALVSLLCSA